MNFIKEWYLLRRWKHILDYNSTNIPPIHNNQRLQVAILLEDCTKYYGKNRSRDLQEMICDIRRNYNNSTYWF
jgi:hypothetical protein